MRAVLADDEVLARQKLRQVLTGIGDIEVVGECTSAGETITLAQLTKPDLLFLDIRLPDMDAFDVVDALSSLPDARLPQIVFVTANESYALRAFEIHAIDYVLKPYTEDRLRAAVNCARERQFAAPEDFTGPGRKRRGQDDRGRCRGPLSGPDCVRTCGGDPPG